MILVNIMNAHINELKSVIGMIPNRKLISPTWSGKVLANAPASISPTELTASNAPIIKDACCGEANFEVKL